MKRILVLLLATLSWLALTRLPVDGAALFTVTIAWGILFGALIRHWGAGPLLFAVAVVADLVALGLGWFGFLGDFWFIPPLVGGLAGILSGAFFQQRPWRTLGSSSPQTRAERRTR
jgi:hypothetical protein